MDIRNGRWRSTWVISPESNELKGTVKINVHYYEDGNVQLNASKEIEVTASPDSEVSISAICYIHLINI